ncbi:MAG TPA: CBS domain-containing protein [candidate division Zixibacteria bacterium]|nr:CBS domain-containing protein [candidate division Zixibacteria bacterium]
MKLGDLLSPELVIGNLAASRKREAIAEMLKKVGEKYDHLDTDLILESVMEREEVEPTNLGRGFAFPHSRTDAVKEMIFSLGISRKGMVDKTPDQKPVHVLCLFLTPRGMTRLYLQAFSALATFARKPGTLEMILAAATTAELIKVFSRSGILVRRELVAKDIMHRNLITVGPESTLKEVANLLFKHKIPGMPVLDKSGKVLGEVTEKELIKAAVPPDYRKAQKSKKILADPFETLVSKEDDITARELMSKKFVTADEKTPVTELANLMLDNNVRRVEILKNGKLVGIVLRSDIVGKIIRG